MMGLGRKLTFELIGPYSLYELVEMTGMDYGTVKFQMKNGFCKWPRPAEKNQTKNPAYKCWENMVQRCTNPKACGYQHWGGRGIKVCPRWMYFNFFIEDMGPRPSRKHTLDRIDVDGDYEPGNVRWATYVEQANNTRQERTGYIQLLGGRYLASFGDVYLGNFKTKEEAQEVIDKFKREHRGYK